MAEQINYALVIPAPFEAILKKLKNKKPDVLKVLEKKIEKILASPVLGKPLRNTLRNYRRIHVDPLGLARTVLASR